MINIRLLTGTLIFIIFYIFYYFQFNDILILTLLLGTFYDFYYSKISNLKISILLFISSLTIFFIFSQYFDFIRLNIYIFLILLILSFFKSRLTNIFFCTITFFFIFFSYELINIDPNIFYFVILLSFINDTTAYIAGNAFKGPLIIPSISPKKTWSGTVVSFLFSFILFVYFDYSFLVSALISLSYFLSDIYFSFIKRFNKLKDFSNFLPGHGGILDRIDSFVLPVFFAILFYK